MTLVPDLTPASPRGSQVNLPTLLCVAQTLLPTIPEPQGRLPSGSGAVDAGPRSSAQAGTSSPEGWKGKLCSPSSFPERCRWVCYTEVLLSLFSQTLPWAAVIRGEREIKYTQLVKGSRQHLIKGTESHLVRITHCAGHFASTFLTWGERGYVTLSHQGSSFVELTLFLFPPENFALLGVWINTRLLLIWVTTTKSNVKWKSLHSLLYIRSLTLD